MSSSAMAKIQVNCRKIVSLNNYLLKDVHAKTLSDLVCFLYSQLKKSIFYGKHCSINLFLNLRPSFATMCVHLNKNPLSSLIKFDQKKSKITT